MQHPEVGLHTGSKGAGASREPLRKGSQDAILQHLGRGWAHKKSGRHCFQRPAVVGRHPAARDGGGSSTWCCRDTSQPGCNSHVKCSRDTAVPGNTSSPALTCKVLPQHLIARVELKGGVGDVPHPRLGAAKRVAVPAAGASSHSFIF